MDVSESAWHCLGRWADDCEGFNPHIPFGLSKRCPIPGAGVRRPLLPRSIPREYDLKMKKSRRTSTFKHILIRTDWKQAWSTWVAPVFPWFSSAAPKVLLAPFTGRCDGRASDSHARMPLPWGMMPLMWVEIFDRLNDRDTSVPSATNIV